MSYSENIKRIREEKGYTKAGLGRKAKLSTRCIEHLEYGKAQDPRISTLTKIAGALGVKIEELIK